MSAFSLRGSTALIALSVSLSLALPVVSLAQEPPAVALETAEWEAVTRFGFTFSVPPGMEVAEDGPRFHAVTSLDDAHTQGAYFAAQILDAEEFAQMPAPGTPGFTAFLSQIGRVSVAATGAVVQMGQFTLHAYRGSATGEDGIERHALVLASQVLDENGEAMLIVVLSAGIGGAAAGALEARYLSGFSVVEEESAEVPTEAPDDEDGAQDEAVDLPVAAAAPEAAEAPAAGGSGMDAAGLAVAGTEDAETDDGEAEDGDTAAAAEEHVAEPAASAAVEEPAVESAPGPQSVTLIEGLVTLELPEGLIMADIDQDAHSADLRLADALSPEAVHTRVAGGALNRGAEAQVRRLLAGLDALVEAEVGGVPVWVVHGSASRNLADERTELAAGIPAQVIVPRLCIEGIPPYMVGILAAPGDEARLDAATAALRLSVPEDATACPDSVIAPIRAALESAPEFVDAEPTVTQPDAPAQVETAALPEGWERLSRFGLSFAAPEGMTIHRDRRERDDLELWLQRRDAAGEVANEIMVRVFTPAGLEPMPHQNPQDPGFAGMLTTFADMPVLATDERLPLGDLTLHLFRGATEREVNGAMRPLRILYLIPEAPTADGLSPWFALHVADQSPEAAEAFEQAFMANLSGAPEAPEEAPAPPVAEAPAVTRPEIPMPPPPSTALEPAPGSASLVASETQAWEQARNLGTPEALLGYLAQFPRGLHSGEARSWLHARDIYAPDERRPAPMTAPQMPEPQPMSDDQAWQIALADGRSAGLWTYLKAFPEGVYAAQARALLAPPVSAPAMPAQPGPHPDPQLLK